MESARKEAEKLGAFIAAGTSPYHAVREAERILTGNGFIELKEDGRFAIEAGKSYFIQRGESALIAFRVPKAGWKGLSIIASHTDSPAFRIKTNPEIQKGPYTVLNTEGYGGMLMAPWFDRPLSVSGRVAVNTDHGIEVKLYDSERDLLMIPSLAIHMDRKANEGIHYSAQNDLLPLYALSSSNADFLAMVADELGIDKERILVRASSFMLSSDNGHALHPNHAEKADPTNRPYPNGGVLIKYSAAQKYMTDSYSGAYVKKLCIDNGIPFQVFHNHSDIPGGSTLGNLSSEAFSVIGADVGMAQLAMHSPYESAGTEDPMNMLRLFRAFLGR